jgi:hypothetical protein
MAYTKEKRFEKFAYETIMQTVLQSELPQEILDSPFLEDVCPNTKINPKHYVEEIVNLLK